MRKETTLVPKEDLTDSGKNDKLVKNSLRERLDNGDYLSLEE